MTPWLHEYSSIASLAEDPGWVGSWARLQQIVRTGRGPMPDHAPFVGVAMALLPDSLDDWVPHKLVPEHLPDLLSAVPLGAVPSNHGAWDATLAGLLTDGAAADILVLLGSFDRSHLRMAVEHHPDDESLLAWVLASTPRDKLDDTTRLLAERLREDLAEGSPKILRALAHITGHPIWDADDPIQAADHGAELADEDLRFRFPDVRGSERRYLNTIGEIVARESETPAGSLLRALCALRKAPAIHPEIISVVSWEEHFQPSDDARIDVAERGLRAANAVRAARMQVRDGDPTPEPEDPILWALHSEAHAPDIELYFPPSVGGHDDLVRRMAAARHPEIVPQLIDRADTREIGLWLSHVAPTEPVLERLLQQPIPHDPMRRYHLALGLTCMGDPSTLPLLRQLAEHLTPIERVEIGQYVHSVHNQEL